MYQLGNNIRGDTFATLGNIWFAWTEITRECKKKKKKKKTGLQTKHFESFINSIRNSRFVFKKLNINEAVVVAVPNH
jgi:hypothetical protein